MEIRHYSHIEWNDLPRIEAPSLALDKIGCRFTNRLSPGARQIRGLGEAFRRCRFRLGRFDPSEDERVDNHALLTNVGNGEFVIIHDGEWEYPMCSALRWCTENNPDGFHIPSPSDRITWLSLPPEGRWIADFRLPMLLRSQIEQCLERGRRDASCHRGLPERLWWNLWQQGRGEGGGGQDSSGGRGSAERPWYARAWDEARRVGEDTVQEVAETAKTAWEALPFTADEAATKAARERIVDSVAGTFDGMATLMGPSAEEILRAHETGDPDAIAQVEQWQQEQQTAAKALGEGVGDALGEVYERSGAAGVVGAAGATVAIGIAGGKGAGALGKAVGKLGDSHAQQVRSVARSSSTGTVLRGYNAANGTVIDFPKPASMSNVEARQWYLAQEARIPELIDSTAPLEQQAQQAFELRNTLRSATRDAMADQKTADMLRATNPNLTWEEVVRKYSTKYPNNEDVWKQIIEASQRSRASVNESLGLATKEKP